MLLQFQGNVISNGTFSKILGPGYRVGWLEVPPCLMPAIYNSGVLNSGGAMNNVAAGVITSALEMGLQQRHLEHLREEYHRRLSAIFQVHTYLVQLRLLLRFIEAFSYQGNLYIHKYIFSGV